MWEEKAAQEKETLVLLTYSWTALDCCMNGKKKTLEAIQYVEIQIFLIAYAYAKPMIVMVT